MVNKTQSLSLKIGRSWSWNLPLLQEHLSGLPCCVPHDLIPQVCMFELFTAANIGAFDTWHGQCMKIPGLLCTDGIMIWALSELVSQDCDISSQVFLQWYNASSTLYFLPWLQHSQSISLKFSYYLICFVLLYFFVVDVVSFLLKWDRMELE